MSDHEPSFFDESDRLERLTKLQDSLVALVKHSDFEIFRPKLWEMFDGGLESARGTDSQPCIKSSALRSVY